MATKNKRNVIKCRISTAQKQRFPSTPAERENIPTCTGKAQYHGRKKSGRARRKYISSGIACGGPPESMPIMMIAAGRGKGPKSEAS